MGTLDPQKTFVNKKEHESGSITERKIVPLVRKNRFHDPAGRESNYESVKDIV